MTAGNLSESIISELDALLTETRYMAVCDALEDWRQDANKPAEGVLVLEKMMQAGPAAQSFDWFQLQLDSSSCQTGSLSDAIIAKQSRTSLASATSRPSTCSEGVRGVRSNLYATPVKPPSATAARAPAAGAAVPAARPGS
eukprot:CAMPEP_0178385110 /NCGR_PEP_ID=MMETSP0689_2-20121128/7866_1 /TAXON_ID=160604 /ORGANISM="Amphidinium massartii, Strain CS-259" /LENGTH=140 /DNA_ID=CAMNT_0020005387 /DNA_START=39 /DNA_END=457 /DNA_ORIENTATION=-